MTTNGKEENFNQHRRPSLERLDEIRHRQDRLSQATKRGNGESTTRTHEKAHILISNNETQEWGYSESMSEYVSIDFGRGAAYQVQPDNFYDLPKLLTQPSFVSPSTLNITDGMTIGFTRNQISEMMSISGLETVSRQRHLNKNQMQLAQDKMRKYVREEAANRRIELNSNSIEKLTNFLISFAHRFDSS